VGKLVVGTRYLVPSDHTVSSLGRSPVRLRVGVVLELVSLNETWDHRHADIFSTAKVIADFRVLDGATTDTSARAIYGEEIFSALERHARPAFAAWLRTID
jgi:hypothetical protein